MDYDEKLVEQLKAFSNSSSQESLSEQDKLELKNRLHQRMHNNKPKRVLPKIWVSSGATVAGIALFAASLFFIYNKNLTTIKPPQSTSASNKEINAEDTQIGNLKLGESLTDINKVYGTPSSKITGPETTWNYNQRGFSVTGSNVWTITISKGFTASTPRGIHIGSSKSAVEKAYADLLPIESNELYGMSSNEQYGIVFAFNGQQVSKITLIDLTDGRFWTPQTNPSILSSTVSSTHNNELKIDSAFVFDSLKVPHWNNRKFPHPMIASLR